MLNVHCQNNTNISNVELSEMPLIFGHASGNRQTDRYCIDRKKVITDLFVIEMKGIYVHVYRRLLIC